MGVSAAGTGNVLLRATGGDLDVQSGIAATDGHISLDAAAGDVLQAGAGDVTTSGTIDVLAQVDVTMTDGAVTHSSGSDVRVEATSGDITLGQVMANGSGIALISGGDVLDGGDTGGEDVQSTGLLIDSTGATGRDSDDGSLDAIETAVVNLSAEAGSHGMFLDESDAVTVRDVATSVNRVGADAGTTAVGNAREDLDTTGDGHVVLRAGGTLTVTDGTDADNVGVDAAGNGNVLLSAAAGNLDVQSGIAATNGHVSVEAAAGDVLQNAAGDITTSGTIDVLAQVDVTMTDGAVTHSSGADVRVEATTGDITLGQVMADGSGIALISGGGVLDGGDSGGEDLQSTGLLIRSSEAIGGAVDHVEIAVDAVTAEAGSDGMFLDETDAVTVREVSTSVSRVAADAGVSAVEDTQEDLYTTGTGADEGHIVVVAGDTLTVTEGANDVLTDRDGGADAADVLGVSAAGTGNVLLRATGGDLDVQSGISATTGDITVVATAGDVLQSGAGEVATGGSGTILVDAEAGSITMQDGARTGTAGGNVRLEADQDVALGAVDAGAGDVSITAAAGNVSDNGDSDTEVSASGLRITAAGNVGRPAGSGNGHLDTAVDQLAAIAEGADGIFISNSQGLTVGEVDSVPARRVQTDGTAAVEEDAGVMAGVTTATGGGNIVVVTTGGDLDVIREVDADQAGNVLLRSVAGAVNVQSTVQSDTGSISVIGQGDVTQGAAGDVQTGGAGTIDVESEGGSITMTDGATAVTDDQNIRYAAAGDVALGGLDAGLGDVSITATAGSITDSGDADVEVIADGLRMTAAGTVGEPAGTNNGLLELTVNRLSIDAGAIYVSNSGALSVDEVGTVPVGRVQPDGGTLVEEDGSSLVGLASNGDIILTAAGDLTVSRPVDASVGDDVLLRSLTGSVAVESVVQSDAGNISVIGAVDVTQSAAGDLLTGGAGTIDVEAEGGTLTMADGATASSEAGNIRYTAAQDVLLGGIESASGDVSVTATAGAVLDNGDADPEVSAVWLRLSAAGNVGQPSGTGDGHLDTAVEQLAAISDGTQGVFVNNSQALTVTEVDEVPVSRVQTDGGSLEV
jgi:hypothetical protein